MLKSIAKQANAKAAFRKLAVILTPGTVFPSLRVPLSLCLSIKERLQNYVSLTRK
jgi:hypothetical protein